MAGKQGPVDKGFGNLGLSHLHSGVFMEQGQGKHGHWLFLPAVWVPSPTSEQSYPCVLMSRLFLTSPSLSSSFILSPFLVSILDSSLFSQSELSGHRGGCWQEGWLG